MNALAVLSKLSLILISSGFVSCVQIQPQAKALTRKDAEEMMARIQPGMTLEDVRRVIPQGSEHISLVSHGGMVLGLRLSERYSILVRFAHPAEGRPDPRLLAEEPALIRAYEHSRVNHTPFLNEDGKVIPEPGGPW